MTAQVIRFPNMPSGYLLWSGRTPEGVQFWCVENVDAEGVVHDQWTFNNPPEAEALLAEKRRRFR